MVEVGIHDKIIHALQLLYRDICSVSINNCLTEWFLVRQGLKPGRGLSATLFSIYVYVLISQSMKETKKKCHLFFYSLNSRDCMRMRK